MLKKLGKKKYDKLPTALVIISFYGTTAQPLGVISIELTTGSHLTDMTFFVINAATMYNVLLG